MRVAPCPGTVRLLRRFARSSRGVAALEFALVMPFLISLFLGSFEITRYISTTRKLTFLANSLAELLARNTTGSVTDDDLHFAWDSTMVTFPDVLVDSHSKGKYWWTDISISFSSVSFKPTVNGCTSNCTYAANVVWSAGGNPRPCTPLLPAPDTASPSPTALPADVYGPGSLIVVDVSYQYTPVVATRLFQPMTVLRSFYLQPRYVGLVNYSGTSSYACPTS